MANHLGMAAHLATQTVRLGWYYGLTRLMERRSRDMPQSPRPKPSMPVPEFRELLADLGALVLRDSMAVRDGVYPAMEEEAVAPLDHLDRVRCMLADLPGAINRRSSRATHGVRELSEARDLPEYYTQDFHFQNGGYLTDESARLYDVQVETLFMGAGAAMRREALRPIAEFMRGRDQRQITLLDVACGTGRFLRYVRLAWPAMRLEGLDLSRAYLDEARGHLGSLRSATWTEANAEAIPLPDASRDLVTCIFLFHELPPDVRHIVTREMARVVKPGGRLILIDSLQIGDRPGWDGLLESFPHRFHEPYFRHYTTDDLEGMLSAAGLFVRTSSLAFLSKVIVADKI